MPKASNKDIYPQDPSLDMEDYLLGTNNNTTNKKTQTYSLGSIFSLFYNFLGYNAFLFTTDTDTYPIASPGCFFAFDEDNEITSNFQQTRKLTFSSNDTYNFNVTEYLQMLVDSDKFLFKLINLEDKNNFIFLKPRNFTLSNTLTSFDVNIEIQYGLSNGNFVNYKKYLLLLEFDANTFDPADYDLTDFTNTSGNPFVTSQDLTDAIALLPSIITNHSGLNLDDGTNPHGTTKSDIGLSNVDNTSDIDKPISTATQTALNLKLDKSSTPSSVYTTDAGGLQVMKPISEFQTDISGKLDKVTTSGVERVYTINTDGSQGTKPTSNFKDVLEFADFASFPATGESGKIYVALDIDSAYYCIGSAYVQIGGNEYLKKDIATYPIASFPLADTDKLLLWQGGVPKKLDKSDLYKQTTITVELMTNLTSDFYAPNDLIIHSTDIIRGSGTITLKVENVAYTLGQLITRGNKITVETTTPSVYNLNTTPTNTNWQRPADWLPMPTNITSADQTFVGLHAVIENSDNYCAFLFTTSAGQYQVDWGDGNVTLHNSGTIAQHQYNYATVSNSTLSSRGYKQAMIKVTPVSGNLLTCNFQQRFVTTPIQNQSYSSGFLECILSMPNASSGQSITFGGYNIRHAYCEKVDIKTIGNATNLTNLFYNFYSLKSLPLFDTINVTNMLNMFLNCYSLQSVPLFDTINVTNMLNMFLNCISLQSVPLFNTINVTSMQNMFNGNSSLQSVPLFNTINVTNMAGMFFGCYSLNFIPAFITTAVTTDFESFATNCNSLNRILMSFNRTVSLQNCQLSKDSLVEIFTNLVDRTATTSANINITGNWGASALTSADRLIATNKNWVITG